MTARRYESGKLVGEARSSEPKFGWGKNQETSPSAVSDAPAEPRAPAKVTRRPPPVVADTPAPVAELAETPVQKLPAGPAPSEAPALGADERIEDTSDMRRFLLRQMVRAARGEITTETVKNVVALSQQVYNATSLELKAATILKDKERSIRALELVSPQDNGDDR